MRRELADVDHLDALEHAEVHDLVGALVEVLHEGGGDLEEAPLDRGTHAELEHLAAHWCTLLLSGVA